MKLIKICLISEVEVMALISFYGCCLVVVEGVSQK